MPQLRKQNPVRIAAWTAIATVLVAVGFWALSVADAPSDEHTLLSGNNAQEASPETPETGSVAQAAGPDQAQRSATASGPDEPATAMAHVHGRFRAPRGPWPGGGVAHLTSRLDHRRGGLLGTFSRLMNPSGTLEPESQVRDLEIFGQGGDPIASAPVGADGTFDLAVPVEGALALRLEHPHLRLAAPRALDLDRADARDLGDIPTETAGTLLVLVAGPEGQPIEGAKVSLGRRPDFATMMAPGREFDIGRMITESLPSTATTDARGAARFAGQPAQVEFSLGVRADGFVSHNERLSVASGRNQIRRVTLSPGGTVRIRTRMADGTPRAASYLLVFPDHSRPAQPFAPGSSSAERSGGRTDKNGSARANGLPLGRVIARIREPGFLPAEKTFDLGSQPHELEFVLDPGVTVRGTLRDENGQPIEGGRVAHFELLGQQVMGFELGSFVGTDLIGKQIKNTGAASGPDGRFELGGFRPDQAAHLITSADGFQAQRADATAGDADVEITMLAATELVGRVVDANTEQPVTDYRVEIKQRAWMVAERTMAAKAVADSKDGRFTIDSAPRVRGTLVVEAEGYATTRRTVNLSAGPVDLGDIALTPPASIEGRVVDPEGRPVANASVRVSKGGLGDSPIMLSLVGGIGTRSAEDGSFQLAGLPGKRIRLVADANGFAPLRSAAIRTEPGKTVGGVVLQFDRGGELIGDLVDQDNQPLAGWSVQVKMRNGRALQFAQTDEAGRFRVTALAAGAHEVQAFQADMFDDFEGDGSFDPEQGNFDLAGLISKAMRGIASGATVIRPGETSEIHLVFDGEGKAADRVRLSGLVTVGDKPLERGVLQLVPAGRVQQAMVANIENGRYDATSVRAGTYEITVQRGLFGALIGLPRTVSIPSGKDHQLDLDLPGGQITGTAVDTEGQPLAGTLLQLRRPGQDQRTRTAIDYSVGVTWTGEDGKFVFDGLPAGDYEVRAKEFMVGRLLDPEAESNSGRSGSLLVSGLRDAEQRTGLNLVVRAGGQVRVRVAGARGAAIVSALDSGGRPFGSEHRAVSGSDGIAILQGLPAGTYRFVADAPRCAPQTSEPLTVRSGETTELTLKLDRGVPTQLRLTGTIPANVLGRTLQYSIWRDGQLHRSGSVIAPTNANGGRTGLTLGNLQPGRYELLVESPEVGIRRSEQEVKGNAATWDLALGN